MYSLEVTLFSSLIQSCCVFFDCNSTFILYHKRHLGFIRHPDTRKTTFKCNLNVYGSNKRVTYTRTYA